MKTPRNRLIYSSHIHKKRTANSNETKKKKPNMKKTYEIALRNKGYLDKIRYENESKQARTIEKQT